MGDTATRVEKEIVVRAATDSSEFGICIGLQQAIWGYSDIDTVPDQMFVVAKKTGGQILLAFDGERAAGFALACRSARSTATDDAIAWNRTPGLRRMSFLSAPRRT